MNHRRLQIPAAAVAYPVRSAKPSAAWGEVVAMGAIARRSAIYVAVLGGVWMLATALLRLA